MDQQTIRLKHQQLKLIRDQLFVTSPYVLEVSIFKPTKVDGKNVLQDEDDFEEPDIGGSINDEDMQISYEAIDTTKVIEVKLDDNNARTSYVRSGNINEFDPDQAKKFLIQDENVPDMTVITYEVPVSLVDDTTQLLKLIKVDSANIGTPPKIDTIHIFQAFHGDMN